MSLRFEFVMNVVEARKSSFSCDFIPYEQINPFSTYSNHKCLLPTIPCKAGKPDLLNPNSWHNIIQVIQSIGIKAGIKQCGTGDRKWLMLECDGHPHSIMRDLIENVF